MHTPEGLTTALTDSFLSQVLSRGDNLGWVFDGPPRLLYM